jgi:hypothetical protein
MHHEHGKGTSVQNTSLKTNIKDNKLNETADISFTIFSVTGRKGAHPLQLIREPIAAASRHLNP